MATGCVKIVKSAKEFDPSTGKFIPEEKRAKSVDLFKGRRWFYFETVMSKTLNEGFIETCICGPVEVSLALNVTVLYKRHLNVWVLFLFMNLLCDASH